MNAEEFIKSLDSIAETMFGEFGYETCTYNEKQLIIKQFFNT
tara:strand:+ start:1769 stop:1894 length:126 start_codon:yes stop_codon:yes gene_type:complete